MADQVSIHKRFSLRVKSLTPGVQMCKIYLLCSKARISVSFEFEAAMSLITDDQENGSTRLRGTCQSIARAKVRSEVQTVQTSHFEDFRHQAVQSAIQLQFIVICLLELYVKVRTLKIKKKTDFLRISLKI